MKTIFFHLVICLALLVGESPPSYKTALMVIQTPVLKWQKGGCYNWGCETAWYSSPAVADLDRDGDVEIIGAAYAIVILDGASGALQKRIDPPGDRQWPSLVVADLQGDGNLEIVTAHGGGYLHVINHLGDLVWSARPTPDNELRSLGVYDLDGNGDLEIMVASTRNYNQWYVYEHTGSLRSGSWPQHNPDSDTNGYTSGCFNENLAAGDLDGDGRGEIVGPNDTHYLAAFQDDGAQMRASAIYGLQAGQTKVWSRVGVHVDHNVDLRGYAICGIEHRPNFAHSPPVIADVNHDGVSEVIIVGNNYNCGTSPYTSLYEMPYLLKADRTRWSGNGFDWTAIPIPDGAAAPRSENYNVIENSHPNPVIADLDNDHFQEILFPSYDGRLHAYWLDKSEHGAWPYAVTQSAEGFIRFASEPVVADLDNNGQAEVIFTSWTQKGSGQGGKLHILDHLGNVLHTIPLPTTLGSSGWDGALAAPTLANIDADPDLEIVLNTAHSGLVAYDLPGTSNARILWGTGRGNFYRSGSSIRGTLSGSSKMVSNPLPSPGEVVTYTITLRNPGPDLPAVMVTDTLPAGLSFAGGLYASHGVPGYSTGSVTWSGAARAAQTVILRYRAIVDIGISQPTLIFNTAHLDGGEGESWSISTWVFVNGWRTFLPYNQR